MFALAFAILFLLLRLIAPDFFWKVLTPVFRISDSITLQSHTLFNSFGNVAQLSLQNEKLTNENASLALQNQVLIKKVESISGLVRNEQEIIAGVVARPPTSPYDTLVLNAGSVAGVTLGMEAFGDSGVPLGAVSSVLSDFSRVTLFSAPGIITNGWVGLGNIPLIIKGAGAGVMNASIARLAGIVEGDTVFAPGPGMLPIGSVVLVESDPSSPSVTLRIMPTANLFSVAWVTLRDTGVKFFSATSTLP